MYVPTAIAIIQLTHIHVYMHIGQLFHTYVHMYMYITMTAFLWLSELCL